MSKRAEIDGWRGEIDAIDDRIVDLIGLRAGYAIRIGRAKRRSGVPVRDRARETEVLARLDARARRKLEGRSVRRIFEKIMELMRQIEEQDAKEHGKTGRPLARAARNGDKE